MADEDDRHIHVRFYHGATLDQGASDTAGRRIYRDKEMVEANFPGDPGRSYVGPALEACFMHRPKPGEDEGKGFLTWAERFPAAYRRFKENDPSAQRTGTPVEHAPFLTPAQVHELRAINIHTVEALANLGEAAIAKYHLRPKVAQAKTWLGETEASAVAAAAVAEKDAIASQFAALRAELEALKAGKPVHGDDPETWDDDRLREYLAGKGVSPRANAARDKLVQAVREMQEMAA